MLQRTLLASVLAFACASAFAAAETYTIDGTHTQTEFTWNHLGFSNPSANFDKIEGTISYDAADPTQSSVEVTIAIDSINSHVAKLDTHLLSEDFFDAAKFPTATFKSSKVEKGAVAGSFKVTGDLTLHGVTKSVAIEAKLNGVGEHPMKKVPAIGFDGQVTLKRSEFGMGNYVPNISDEIRIHITTEALAAKSEAK